MFKLVLEKTEEPEIKLPTSVGSWKKQEGSRKTSISALLTMPKTLTVWIRIYKELLKLTVKKTNIQIEKWVKMLADDDENRSVVSNSL